MNDDCKNKPFSLILQRTSAYIKIHDVGTKWMYCLTERIIKNIWLYLE